MIPRMALRFHEHILRGELDSRTRGRMTRRVCLARVAEQVGNLALRLDRCGRSADSYRIEVTLTDDFLGQLPDGADQFPASMRDGLRHLSPVKKTSLPRHVAGQACGRIGCGLKTT